MIHAEDILEVELHTPIKSLYGNQMSAAMESCTEHH